MINNVSIVFSPNKTFSHYAVFIPDGNDSVDFGSFAYFPFRHFKVIPRIIYKSIDIVHVIMKKISERFNLTVIRQ